MADQHEHRVRGVRVPRPQLGHHGQEPGAQLDGGLPTGQPTLQVAVRPGGVDLLEQLAGGVVGPAFQVTAEHLVHAVDHLDGQPVPGGEGLGGLLGAQRGGGVHGGDRLQSHRLGQRRRLRPAPSRRDR
jgi:hypothetical protein